MSNGTFPMTPTSERVSRISPGSLAGIGYRIDERWNVATLCRHLRWDFDSDRALDHLEFSGPLLGATYRF